MTIIDKRAVMHFRAEDAWLKLRDLRGLMTLCPECAPLNLATETELRRIIAEAQYLLGESHKAARQDQKEAAE